MIGSAPKRGVVNEGSPAADSATNVDIDPFLLNPIRLAIMAALVSDSYYLFRYLCELGGGRPAVYRQVTRLRTQGYIETAVGAYACMWVRRTPFGYQQFTDHLAGLRELVGNATRLGESAPPEVMCEANGSRTENEQA